NKDITINSLKEFEEIILIGSGKGVASVKTIDQIKWKRKSLKYYKVFLKHYKSAINNCPRYR
ncbi:aminotransferase, partial [Candidatus Pelagibacter sp.]|nr:aminotransferase [Candidatus Pelagibacter sp.]